MAMTPASSGSRLAGASVKGLNCPSCGGPLTVRGFEHTVSVVCPQCLAVLNAKDPNLQILQKFTEKTRLKLLIPLGSRGSWQGTVYEVIGDQRRTIGSGTETYSWSEYNGHWNDGRTLRALPRPGFSIGAKQRIQHAGTIFTHFTTAQAVTTYVLGEFPWQVRRGERVLAKDFVAPPRILSSESTAAETTWSLGEYVRGEEIWRAFKLPGAAPKPSGVFANQPSPLVQKSKELWRLCGTFLLVAFALLLAGYLFAPNQQVFSDSYHYTAGSRSEASFVTPVFALNGRTTNVEIST